MNSNCLILNNKAASESIQKVNFRKEIGRRQNSKVSQRAKILGTEISFLSQKLCSESVDYFSCCFNLFSVLILREKNEKRKKNQQTTKSMLNLTKHAKSITLHHDTKRMSLFDLILYVHSTIFQLFGTVFLG